VLPLSRQLHKFAYHSVLHSVFVRRYESASCSFLAVVFQSDCYRSFSFLLSLCNLWRFSFVSLLIYAPRFELSHFFRSALLLELRDAYIKLKRELKEATPTARISCLSGLKRKG
jgi:hypothetical protein